MGIQDDVGDVGMVPRCQTCGSERITKQATACWNREYGLWELEAASGDVHCQVCGKAAKLTWSQHTVPPNLRIRELNDRFRCHGIGRGSIMVTPCVQEKGTDFVVAAIQAVRSFDDFSRENDPWGEHDFGAVEVGGKRIFFKLDYYDLSLECGSENPANEGCTHRVLTIMLAEEY